MGQENKNAFTTAIVVALIGAIATITVAIINSRTEIPRVKASTSPPKSSKPAQITKRIELVNAGQETARFVIVEIPKDDPMNYAFTFHGCWYHPWLGCQNELGEVLEQGRIAGNIKIQVDIQSLDDESILSSIQYYNGSAIIVRDKNVRVICSPRDANSSGRNPDGHMPFQHLNPCDGREYMTVTYYTST